jgi:hypothetical protein
MDEEIVKQKNEEIEKMKFLLLKAENVTSKEEYAEKTKSAHQTYQELWEAQSPEWTCRKEGDRFPTLNMPADNWQEAEVVTIDIRQAPKRGGCGIGGEGKSFEQALDMIERQELEREQRELEREQQRQKEEQEYLASLTEKQLLLEILLALKPQHKLVKSEEKVLKAEHQQLSGL